MVACYTKPCNSNRWHSLRIGRAVPIRPGDVCSLIPEKSWFKITLDESGAMELDDSDVNAKRKAANPTEEEPPDKKLRSEGDSVETIYSQSKSVLDDWDAEAGSPAALDSKKDATDDSSAVEAIPTDDAKKNGSADATTPAEESPTSVAETSANEGAEQSHDESGKKIKWDCGRHFSDQTDEQSSNETAEDSGEVSARPAEENPAAETAEARPAADEPPRDKCTYGSQCYRRNSEHRARFSHPGDADYDVLDPRPECPYGVRCYRKNPQHKRDFKHTKNRRSRAQTPIRTTGPDDAASGNEQSSAEESVDESEYEPSLYDGTSDDYFSEFDDRSDADATSD